MKTAARWVGVLGALVLVSAQAVASAAQSDPPKRYLVGLKPGASAKGLGVTVKREWAKLNLALVETNAAGLAKLEGHGNVAYVEEDRPIMAFSTGAYQDLGELTWGVQAVGAQEAWSSGATGQGIKVCVLDTGIDYSHPEFMKPDGTSIIKDSKNFVDDGRPDARDGNKHGTHVAGTIAAQWNGSGVGGVAPDVDLYVGRVLNDAGQGYTSDFIEGLTWCSDTVGAHIASMSLGSSKSSKAERAAFDAAYADGMLIIAASGNDGRNGIAYPAGYDSVVAVGAIDANLSLASFSNYGRDQELVGPGVDVLSSTPPTLGLKTSASEDGAAYVSNPLEYTGQGAVTGPLVDCGIGKGTSSCTGKPESGPWIALIDRGRISFTDKVSNAMAQGASAVIIVNDDSRNPDDPGDFTLGMAGGWVSTVSVSYNAGVAIRSGGLGTGTVSVQPSAYAYLDGTSMATPHVSAVAALAWSANPGLTNQQIRTILQQSATDLGAAGTDTRYGYGLAQAGRAVEMARGAQ